MIFCGFRSAINGDVVAFQVNLCYGNAIGNI
jgi:hypothetical protein